MMLLCLLCVSFVACYGWGMRGTVVGGEKGAMLPGMYIGLTLALFAGGGIAQYFWIPAAAGLIGMTYGGTEPYGGTMIMVIDGREKGPQPLKGSLCLALKGGLWFSVCGGFIGLSMSSMGSRYSVKDLLVFCVCIPVFQALGYLIFNTPYNEEKHIHPKTYLCLESDDSREEWGSNVGILFVLLVFSIIKSDWLMLAMTSFGFLFGAIGWVFAIWFYYFTVRPFPNGKYLFGSWVKKGIVDGWKNMEFSLGAIGSIGIFLGYFVCRKSLDNINNTIAQKGLFAPLKNYDKLSFILITICFVGVLAVNGVAGLLKLKNKKVNPFATDIAERLFYSTLPFVLVVLCSLPAARLMTAFMLIFALAVKNCMDRFDKYIVPACIVYIALVIVTYIGDILLGGYPAQWLFFAGGIPYILSEIVWHAIKFNKHFGKVMRMDPSYISVWGFEMFCILVITITAFAVL